jgi:L-gulonolactone oxidase
VPYSHAQSCLRALRAWFESEFANPNGLRPHCLLEVRFSEADDIWLSPSYGEKTCWIGIVQYKCVASSFIVPRPSLTASSHENIRPYNFNVPYRILFGRFERILIRYGGRPHWAKAHGLRPDTLSVLYPKFKSFRDLLNLVDPEGVFQNEYVARHIFGATGARFGARVFKARP